MLVDVAKTSDVRFACVDVFLCRAYLFVFILFFVFFFFFFFQAEDGIRDLYVTGVQTCALPIWHGVDHAAPADLQARFIELGKQLLEIALDRTKPGWFGGRVEHPHSFKWEIGRASCRERV